MGNYCCQLYQRCADCCYLTNPKQFLYPLNQQQKAIIRCHCDQFSDVKYLIKQSVSFTLNDTEYNVQQGFVCDAVSSGLMISNLIAVDTAIMHDFLYATHPDAKCICDTILEPVYRRYIVGIFGESAWVSSGNRGALMLTQNQTGMITFNIYHVADYSTIAQAINLSEDDSREFDSFFESLRVCDS